MKIFGRLVMAWILSCIYAVFFLGGTTLVSLTGTDSAYLSVFDESFWALALLLSLLCTPLMWLVWPFLSENASD